MRRSAGRRFVVGGKLDFSSRAAGKTPSRPTNDLLDISSSSARPLLKRVFDVVMASVALVVTLPLMLIVAVLIRVRMGPPVFFCQTRIGQHGRPFTLVKLEP